MYGAVASATACAKVLIACLLGQLVAILDVVVEPYHAPFKITCEADPPSWL